MGYTLVANTLPRSNNNTEFQGWGKQISDAIANCGIVRESDANVGTQIDWSTVANPNTSNQSRGYEIYKFADDMQATTPVYFKIEYGSSAVSNLIPAIWITVGSGANSSGNVTGNTTTRQTIVSAVSSANQTSYYSGTSGRFSMFFSVGTSITTHMHLGMERILDANGAPSDIGLGLIMGCTAGTKYQVLWTPATGNVAPYETTYGILTPAATPGSGLFGGVSGQHLAAYPLFFFNGATLCPPQTMFLCYFNGDFTTGSPVYMPMYGSDILYLPVGNNVAPTACARGGVKTTLMMRWD